MLNLRKFRGRPFTGAALAVLVFLLAAFGTLYYATRHLHFILGYSPLAAGVRLLPLAGAVFAGAALTGRLTLKLGIKPVVLTGMILGTAGIFLLARVGDGTGHTGFLPTLILLGLAIGLSAAPCTDVIMGAFPGPNSAWAAAPTTPRWNSAPPRASPCSAQCWPPPTRPRLAPGWPAHTCRPPRCTRPRTPSAVPWPSPSRWHTARPADIVVTTGWSSTGSSAG